MITDLIIMILISPAILLINMLPTISITLPENLVYSISNIFAGLGYFLPVGLILALLGIQIALMSSRILVALVVRIKSFIPTMGA